MTFLIQLRSFCGVTLSRAVQVWRCSLKFQVLWDVAVCRLANPYRRSNISLSSSSGLSSPGAYFSFFDPEDEGVTAIRNFENRSRYGVPSQKAWIIIIVITAIRISDLALFTSWSVFTLAFASSSSFPRHQLYFLSSSFLLLVYSFPPSSWYIIIIIIIIIRTGSGHLWMR